MIEDMEEVKKAYTDQITNCRYKVDALGNPVKMLMSLQQFADIWDQSGHWDQRGCGKGKYCMARYNDIGHYEVGNVKIILNEQNASEAHKGRTRSKETKAKMSAWQKGVPKSAEHCANMSTAKKGKPWSEARRAAHEAKKAARTFDSQTD